MSHTSFLGIPVEGDITQSYRSRVEQKGPEEFAKILQPLLEHPKVEAIRWQQYTPYFNDGDACEFRVGESYVKLVGHDEGGDYDDGFLNSYDDTLREYIGTPEYKWRNEPAKPGSDPSLAEVFKAFVIENGSFDNMLLDAFGDHAKVTVTKEQIEVEFYEHD